MPKVTDIIKVGTAVKYRYSDGALTYKLSGTVIDIESGGETFKIQTSTLHPDNTREQIETTSIFSQITINYGASNSEEYIEYLINNGFFLDATQIVDSEGDLAEVVDGALEVIAQEQISGVPNSFSMLSGNGKSLFIQKGQKNEWRVRPQVLNEHAESSREIQAIVNASTIVGQVFKHSQDNINGIALTMASAAGISLDDFESYADSAALQAVWVTGGTNDALLETVIAHTGSQSMKLNGALLNDSWINTVPSVDYTDFVGSFDFQQNEDYSRLKFEVFIGDGVNTKSAPIVSQEPGAWHHIEIDESAMTEDGGGTTDPTAITQIGFRCSDKDVGDSGYVDNLVATPPAGSIQAKLWDMGTDIPVTAVTQIDDGTQYTELGDRGLNGGTVAAEITIPLLGGKKIYQLNTFAAGVALEIPANTLLNVGHYYAITLHYVDTLVAIYGPDTSFAYKYYNNGYAFTAPDISTPITAIGDYSDLSFQIFSTQDVYVTQYFQVMVNSLGAVASPGVNSTIMGHIEDKNMKVVCSITTQAPTAADITLSFEIKPLFLPKGGKFEVYLNDDYSDDIFIHGGAIGYLHEPSEVNG